MSRLAVQGMVLVNPFLRFTKTTDVSFKSPLLRARVPERLLSGAAKETNANAHFAARAF